MARTYLSAFLIGLIIVSPFSIGHAERTGGGDNRHNLMTQKSIEEVLRKYTDTLMSFQGVVGCAQGLCDGKPCIKVLVSEMTPDVLEKIPRVLEGYPVEIEEIGTIKAFPENKP